MSPVVKRLPEVRDLYAMLPKGTEGAKEFARIVDLLLFHEARRSGKTLSLFNDSSGDYHGLDSFQTGPFRQFEQTGYQYKFFPSPLSSRHRSVIKQSLETARRQQAHIKLRKWILITPQNLTESSTNADGGDVTWFEKLREDTPDFEIEHWGHRNLQLLFLHTPSLCLRYYPELIDGGAHRRHTIEDTRSRYDKAMASLYREILFVGIPVYKQETARGIPFQDIYIPLSVIADSAGHSHSNTGRIDPLLYFHRARMLSSATLVQESQPSCGSLHCAARLGLSKNVMGQNGTNAFRF